MQTQVEQGQMQEALSRRSLSNVVREIIDRRGPIPFSEYMAYSNYGTYDLEGAFAPGYYTGNRIRIGNSVPGRPEFYKDFTTSPEVSLMFGITLAKQIVEMRHLMEEDDFTILEVGGGNGTMAYDILSGIRFFDPEAFNEGKYKYLILDKSKVLREKQEERLKYLPVQLIDGDARTLPPDLSINGVVITNELLDDLPADCVLDLGDQQLQLFVKNGVVGFEQEYTSPTPGIQSFMDMYQLGGGVRPISLDTEKFMGGVSRVLESGFVITIDFHHRGGIPFHFWGSPPDTAVFEYLGRNIWCDVDFRALRFMGERLGIRTLGLSTQPDFLTALGIWDLTRRIRELKVDQRDSLGIDRYIDGKGVADLTSQWALSVMIQSKGLPALRLTGLVAAQRA